MSPPGRPKGEYRRAQHEGRSISLQRRRLLQGAAALPWPPTATHAADAANGDKVLHIAFPAPESTFDPALRPGSD